MGRILAIDYGLKRVGIAVTDPLKIIAKPLTTVANNEIYSWLAKYILSENVEAFIVGMPLRLNGETTHLTEHVKKFIEQLQQKFPLILIETVDERLTSKLAMQSLVDSGVTKNKRKEKGALDSVSASLILQTYLSKVK